MIEAELVAKVDGEKRSVKRPERNTLKKSPVDTINNV